MSDDPRDLYRIWVPREEVVHVDGERGGPAAARIWGPQTVAVDEGLAARRRDLRGPSIVRRKDGARRLRRGPAHRPSGTARYVLSVTARRRDRAVPSSRPGFTAGFATRTRTRSAAKRAQQRVGDRGRRAPRAGRMSARPRPPARVARPRGSRPRRASPSDAPRVADVERDVEDEFLALFLLVRVHAVAAEEAQAAQLDRDHATAARDGERSTCSLARRARAGSWRRARTRRRRRRRSPRARSSEPVAGELAERALAREADQRPAGRARAARRAGA